MDFNIIYYFLIRLQYMHITAWHILTYFWWEPILSKLWIRHILKQYLRLYNLSFSRNVFSSVFGHQEFKLNTLITMFAVILILNLCISTLHSNYFPSCIASPICTPGMCIYQVDRRDAHLQQDSNHAKIKKQLIRRPSREGEKEKHFKDTGSVAWGVAGRGSSQLKAMIWPMQHSAPNTEQAEGRVTRREWGQGRKTPSRLGQDLGKVLVVILYCNCKTASRKKSSWRFLVVFHSCIFSDPVQDYENLHMKTKLHKGGQVRVCWSHCKCHCKHSTNQERQWPRKRGKPEKTMEQAATVHTNHVWTQTGGLF